MRRCRTPNKHTNCMECMQSLRFNQKRGRLNGYCSWDCKDRVLYRFWKETERLRKEVSVLVDVVAKLNAQLKDLENRLQDKEYQIWAKNKVVDEVDKSLVWSYPSFLPNLEKQIWFFCVKGNCDDEKKHGEKCKWQVCSPEATNKLSSVLENKDLYNNDFHSAVISWHSTVYEITGRIPFLQQIRISTGMKRNLRRFENLSAVNPVAQDSCFPRAPTLRYWKECSTSWIPSSQVDLTCEIFCAHSSGTPMWERRW